MDGRGRIIVEFGTQRLTTLPWHKRIEEGKGGGGCWRGARDTSSFAVSPGLLGSLSYDDDDAEDNA